MGYSFILVGIGVKKDSIDKGGDELDHSREDVKQIEDKAKNEQQQAEKAKRVIKDAKKNANPQRENNEFPST